MKVRKLYYQRNGVAGVGFYQCEYAHEGESGLIATFEIDETDKVIDYTRCRAINPADLKLAYRGDRMAGELQAYFSPMMRDGKTLYDLIEIIEKANKQVI